MTMKTPVVLLTEKDEEKEYPLVLKNRQLDALEKETGIGVPAGLVKAMQDGRIGISYLASVITQGISRHKRTSRDAVLGSMALPVDEYLLPCLSAVFIGAGRPEIAEALSKGETFEDEEEEEPATKLGDKEHDPANPTTPQET